MQAYVIDQKTIDSIGAAAEELGRCIDTSTDYGRVLCGTSIKAALPWDASPNWELRHKSPTDALLIDGMPMWRFADESKLDAIYQTVLLTSMRRGLPWAWRDQKTAFQRILSREQYIAAGHVVASDPAVPHLGCAGYPDAAPETITLTVEEAANCVRVGWVDTNTMMKNIPADLLQATFDECFRNSICPKMHALVRKDVIDGRYQLTLGTSGVSSSTDASSLAVAALEYLRAISSERMTWVDLEPGQMLVLPNRFGQHAIQLPLSGCVVRRTYWSRDLRVHRALAPTGDSMLFDRDRLRG